MQSHYSRESLTPYNPHAEVELLHSVAERSCNQTAPREAPTHDHDGSAAVFVHQDAADGTWEGKGDMGRDELLLYWKPDKQASTQEGYS